MKIVSGFELKHENGENLVIYKGDNPELMLYDTITLSEETAYLWECLKSGEKTKEQLLNMLLDKYDISTVLALNDIDIFVKTLKGNGIIEI